MRRWYDSLARCVSNAALKTEALISLINDRLAWTGSRPRRYAEDTWRIYRNRSIMFGWHDVLSSVLNTARLCCRSPSPSNWKDSKMTDGTTCTMMSDEADLSEVSSAQKWVLTSVTPDKLNEDPQERSKVPPKCSKSGSSCVECWLLILSLQDTCRFTPLGTWSPPV